MAYLINNIDLKDNYGVIVQKCLGVFDMPERMGLTQHDWLDEDGIEAFVDEEDIYFKQRTIKLKCKIFAESLMTLYYNLGVLQKELYSGQFLLSTPYGNYTCLLKSGSRVIFPSGRNGTPCHAEFSLILNEISMSIYDPPVGDENIGYDKYWIDKVDLLAKMGIVVEQSDGMFDFSEMKKDNKTFYKRESDLNNKRGVKNIYLNCSVVATSINDFSYKMRDLRALLAKPGLRTLNIPIDGYDKAFNVYCKSGFNITELTRNSNQIIGKFTLRFIEAVPSIITFLVGNLFDTDGQQIETTEYIPILVPIDYEDIKSKPTYLYTDAEAGDETYLYTDAELDVNPDAEKVYLYTENEII